MLKKNSRKFSIVVAMATLLAVISVMGFGAVSNASTATHVKSAALKIGNKTVTKKTYSLKKGKKATIKVNAAPQKAQKAVTFRSSNPKVAAVSGKGIVTAKKKGTAKISIVVEGKDKKTITTWVKIKVTKKSKENTPSEEDTETIDITEVNVSDGTNNIYGKLYTPKEEGVYPAIIMCHGYNGTNADFSSDCWYFAENGYVACAFDFCGGSTRSLSSGSSTDMTIFTEKSNLLAVYNYIKGLSNVDASQIFLFGGSQGGLVTALATEELADEVKGMILYFPAFNIPDDWRRTYPSVDSIPEKVDFWGLTLGKEFFASMHDFYPFDNVGGFSKNVLILYGENDAIVPYSYMEKAKEIYNAELIVYPNEGHGFTPATGKKAREEVLKFMQSQ